MMMNHVATLDDYVRRLNSHAWEQIEPLLTEDVVLVFPDPLSNGRGPPQFYWFTDATLKTVKRQRERAGEKVQMRKLWKRDAPSYVVGIIFVVYVMLAALFWVPKLPAGASAFEQSTEANSGSLAPEFDRASQESGGVAGSGPSSP